MDPQQRVLLERGYEALHGGGLKRQLLEGSLHRGAVLIVRRLVIGALRGCHAPAAGRHPRRQLLHNGVATPPRDPATALEYLVRGPDGVLVRETRFRTKLQSGVIVATGRLAGLLRPRAMC